MTLLNGQEIAGYIKERQAKQVRALRQSWRVFPRLAILRTGENQVIDTYLRLKKNYGEDILISVDVYDLKDDELLPKITELNGDELVHGIIIQLPLANPAQTETALNAVVPGKDVDGLGQNSPFTPATAMAINWLLSGYNIKLAEKKIAIIGNGRLVGAPLFKIWQEAGLDVSVYDISTEDLVKSISGADIIVSATGVPGLIKDAMVKNGAVVIDAGTASEGGKIVGDVSTEIYDRKDIKITPIKGGVGPLTIAALFDNLITSARNIADTKGQQDLN